ncbi:MAG TPA: Hsp20/alpha crystallin family protein [Spirochaetia bacterium]|nr:Hsp20/alpha crystallin family protein [Spirochaetales bacterium]HRY72073.1 Hsp20/alpha crystallin family protein [Spirochaetia bacterium]
MDQRYIDNARGVAVPACSITEDEGLVTVKLEMPGVPKEELEVRIEGNSLEVSGTRRRAEERGKYLLRERRADSFRKRFTLDETIDREKVAAELADGILVLKLHIREAAKPRKIEIS